MNREEQIRQAANEFAYSLCSIRPELNADSFVQGAKWSDANPKHYSFKEAMDACMGSYEEGGRQLLYVANQTAERTKKEVINKALEFINEYFYEHPHCNSLVCTEAFDSLEDFIENFKKAMEA